MTFRFSPAFPAAIKRKRVPVRGVFLFLPRLGVLFLFASLGAGAASRTSPLQPLFSIHAWMQEWEEQKGGLSPSVRNDLQVLKGAVRKYRQDQFSEAARNFLDARLGEGTSVGDHFLYFLALCYQGQARQEEARDAFERLRQQYPSSRLAAKAAQELALDSLEKKDYSRAAEVLSPFQDIEDPALLLARAKALMGMGDYSSSGSLLEKIYSEMPASPEAAEAGRLLSGMQQSGKRNLLLSAAAWRRVEHLLEAGQFRAAYSESLKAVLPRDGADHFRALLLKARAAVQIRYYSVAVRCLRAIDDRGAAVYPEAKLLLALCYRKQNADAAFLSACEELSSRFPGHPATEEALFHLSNYYLLKGRNDQAVAAAARALALFPNGDLAQPVLWRLAWNHYQQKEYAKAEEAFRAGLERFTLPSYRRAALYWLGRSLRNRNQDLGALAVFSELKGQPPLDYYGLLAQKEIESLEKSFPREEVEAERGRLFPNLLPVPAKEATAPEDTGKVDRATLQRITELLEADLPSMALEEIDFMQRTPSPSPGLLLVKAQILSRMGQRWNAVRIVSQTIPGYSSLDLSTLPRSLWEILYPLEHWAAIRQSSQKEQVEPHLVAAMIRQESLFQADAKSRANAIGLMQILPSTGQELARTLGKPFSVNKLYQADFNIQLGTRYFSNLLRRFQGRWDLALAAYNAGLSRVSAWIKELPEDSAEFIESIPLTETRNYVKNILTHREHYRLLYTE